MVSKLSSEKGALDLSAGWISRVGSRSLCPFVRDRCGGVGFGFGGLWSLLYCSGFGLGSLQVGIGRVLEGHLGPGIGGQALASGLDAFDGRSSDRFGAQQNVLSAG